MAEKHLPLGRNLKIGLFQLGSGMADVLITGVWNRVMISDLGFRATPISLLASLRYFLAPLSVWAGGMSDRHAIFGYHRLFWIWSGRAMMAVSMLAIGFLTGRIVGGAPAGLLTWVGITMAMLLFSLGNSFSNSTFLALVYDRAPSHQRGRAVGIVWTFLLTGFAVGGAFFATLLPASGTGAPGEIAFSASTIWNLFAVAVFVMSTLWFVSLVGEEQHASRGGAREPSGEPISLRRDLQAAMSSHPLRMFTGYLGLSMAFAFSQDAVLEPFAADVFGMSADRTTRFAAYWGGAAIVGSVGFLVLSRKVAALDNPRMSQFGVISIAFTLVLFATASLGAIEALVIPGLVMLGLGLGMWNIGTLGLMMEMSPSGRAGTFLGFWTLLVTVARGAGVSSGGILRDIAYMISGNLPISYAVVFGIGALGLVVSYAFLMQTDTEAFQADYQEIDTAGMLGASLD